MMRNQQIKKDIKEQFESSSSYGEFFLIQDAGFREPRTPYPPMQYLGEDTQSAYDFAVATGAGRMDIIPAAVYSRITQACSTLGEVNDYLSKITKTFQNVESDKPTKVTFYQPYQVAWMSLAIDVDGTEDILQVYQLTSQTTPAPQKILGKRVNKGWNPYTKKSPTFTRT
ncbi:MAG: hypothetical protein LBF65_03370 [Holosporales bacterium]|jgi:hypothetical protein|nr:hypothetical protein [Holosporales bacterium]